nr:CsbD family protein [Desulfobulbaceae bacterium]
MKSSTKDKAQGTFHQVKGKTKEVAGRISDNHELEVEGTIEKLAGKGQRKVGEIKNVFEK